MKVFYDDRYVAAAHAFDTTKKASWVADFIRSYENLIFVSPKATTRQELAIVHDIQYVKAIRTGLGDTKSIGFLWDPWYWIYASASTGGVIDAAFTALEEGVAGSLSSGLHHASTVGGGGFCTFNGLALAAKMALGVRPMLGCARSKPKSYCKKVLILDLDAHCGGGTYEIVKDDPRIHQIDISTCKFDSYKGDPERHRLHIVNSKNYLNVLELELERASSLGFDLVLYNAGMDPHEDCNYGGLPGMNSHLIEKRETLVFEWGRKNHIPICFVLAGGYTGPDIWEKKLAALHGITVAAAGQTPIPNMDEIESNPPAPFVELNKTKEDPLFNELGLYENPWEDDGFYFKEFEFEE